jgi:4-diphosphocytidyl-2-C-methyl-D-erythritol kinase
MVCFPNAKINLGLNVIRKRPDGFHDLESLFLPIPLCDILEFVEAEDELSFHNSGLTIDSPAEKNLVVKAYQILADVNKLPPIRIYLNKIIPFGAGLGGGSADASFMLKALNDYFKIGLTENELEVYAAKLGSDCPFFIRNKAAFVCGRGDIIEAMDFSLAGKWIVLVKPPFSVPTPLAYAGIKPKVPDIPLKNVLRLPFEDWQNLLLNDFEAPIFERYPQVGLIKQYLTETGAFYSAMSGSGSSVFGLYFDEPDVECVKLRFPDFYVWKSIL